MDVRLMGPGEKKAFLALEREAIYPELPEDVWNDWINGEEGYEPLCYVLKGEDGEIIGGAVFEIQDHLTPEEVVLQFDALFVKESQRRKGYGGQLITEALEMARLEYKKRGLCAVALLAQNTSLDIGAREFCITVIGALFPDYKEARVERRGVTISVFLFPFDG